MYLIKIYQSGVLLRAITVKNKKQAAQIANTLTAKYKQIIVQYYRV